MFLAPFVIKGELVVVVACKIHSNFVHGHETLIMYTS